MVNLGASSFLVMDAVAAGEQYMAQLTGFDVATVVSVDKQASSGVGSVPEWGLLLHREFFPPWHNTLEDKVASQLVYHQIIDGVKAGLYHCESVRHYCAVWHYVSCTMHFTEHQLM